MRRKRPILPVNGAVVQTDCRHEVVKSLDCSLFSVTKGQYRRSLAVRPAAMVPSEHFPGSA